MFFLDLPVDCPTYYGPHSVNCLNIVWGAVGCLPEGEEYPGKLTSYKVDPLSKLSYRFDLAAIFITKGQLFNEKIQFIIEICSIAPQRNKSYECGT